MASFIVTTTGTLGQVTLNDLGGLVLTDPTVVDLSQEFEEEDIFESADLENALSLGYITITWDGKSITTLSDILNVQPRENQDNIDLLDLVGGVEGQSVGFNASGDLVPVTIGDGTFGSLYAAVTADFTSPATWGNIVFDINLIQNQSTSISLNGNGEDIEINEDGLYYIQYNAFSTSIAGTENEIRIQQNSSIVLTGSISSYEGDPGDPGALTKTVIANLVDGDILNIQSQGTGDIRAGASFHVIRLQARGAQGPQGPQGVGSGSGFNWLGNWSSAVDYVVDDVVLYPVDNSVYICIQDIVPGQGAFQQPNNPTYWDLFLPAPGASVDTNEYLNIYDAAGNQAISNAAFTDITWDSQRKISAGFSHTPGSADITISADGTYLVNYVVTFDQADGNRRELTTQVQYDNGTGYNVLPGTIGSTYGRNAAQTGTTSTGSFVIDASAGDRFKIQALSDVAGSGFTRPNGSSVTAIKAVGEKGANGATGAGSNVIIQDGGSNVFNTPHGTLNFVGAQSINDNADGSVTITLPSVGTFGTEYFYNEVTTTITSTSTTFINVHTFAPTVIGGSYKVEYCYCWNHQNAGNDIETEFRIDGANAFPQSHRQEPKDPGADQRHWTTVSRDVVLAAGQRSFTIESRASAGNTINVYFSNIRITRVG